MADQAAQLAAQGLGEDGGEGGEQDTAGRILTGEVDGAMQGDDGLTRARRASDAGRAGELTLHPLPLGGMEKDRPLVPGRLQGAGQFLHVGHDPKAPLGIGMGKGIAPGHHGGAGWRGTPGRQLEQGLRRLSGQMTGQIEEAVFIGLTDIRQPVGGDAIVQQVVVRPGGEQAGLGDGGYRDGGGDFDDALADLHELGGAGAGMDLQLASGGPFIGGIVMIDVAEQQAAVRAVDDEAQIAAGAHGPEILVPRPVELVAAQAGVGRVELQVEGRGLDRLLFFPGEAGQAVGEGVGDAKVHGRSLTRCGPWARAGPPARAPMTPGDRARAQRTRNTFITSSPKWLMTLTAMRPVAGLGKGREVSLRRLSQTSSLISALRVVLSAL